jgi:hypothetical protein
MAALIFENRYLIPKAARSAYAQPDKFLLVGTDLEAANEARDKLEIEFERVRTQIDEVYDSLYEIKEEQDKKQEEVKKH